MLFKLLYIPESLDIAKRGHFSDYEMAMRHNDYEMAMRHKKELERVSLGDFLSILKRRLDKKNKDAIRSHIDTILP